MICDIQIIIGMDSIAAITSGSDGRVVDFKNSGRKAVRRIVKEIDDRIVGNFEMSAV